MTRSALLLMGLPVAARAGGHDDHGSSGCPCVAMPAGFTTQTQAAGKPSYPAEVQGYGFGCKAHDEGHEYCGEADTNTSDGGAGDWCKDTWCIIDPNNCDKYPRFLTYTGDPTDYFSYEACEGDDFKGNSWVGTTNNCPSTQFHDKYHDSFCSYNGGQDGCLCLATPDDPAEARAEQGWGKPLYPTEEPAWGWGCAAHDKGEDMNYCNSSSYSTADGDEGDWCEDVYCAVDPERCDMWSGPLTYTNRTDDFFTYETCYGHKKDGNGNSNTKFMGNGWVGRCVSVYEEFPNAFGACDTTGCLAAFTSGKMACMDGTSADICAADSVCQTKIAEVADLCTAQEWSAQNAAKDAAEMNQYCGSDCLKQFWDMRAMCMGGHDMGGEMKCGDATCESVAMAMMMVPGCNETIVPGSTMEEAGEEKQMTVADTIGVGMMMCDPCYSTFMAWGGDEKCQKDFCSCGGLLMKMAEVCEDEDWNGTNIKGLGEQFKVCKDGSGGGGMTGDQCWDSFLKFSQHNYEGYCYWDGLCDPDCEKQMMGMRDGCYWPGDDATPFEGIWLGTEGKMQAMIHGMVVYGLGKDEGMNTDFRYENTTAGSVLYVNHNGTDYMGTLARGNNMATISWNDGDMWTRGVNENMPVDTMRAYQVMTNYMMKCGKDDGDHGDDDKGDGECHTVQIPAAVSKMWNARKCK